MKMAEFNCEAWDLCFNDGICQRDGNISTGFLYCECPATSLFGEDFSMFHDLTCTKPKYFYLAQFIEMSCISLVAIVLMASLFKREKGRGVRKTAFFSGLGTAFMWAFALGVLAQAGTFEIAGFFLAAMLVACSWCGLNLIDTQVTVLRGMQQLEGYRLFRKTLWITTIACSTMCIAFGIGWIVLCRTRSHNILVRAFMTHILFWNTVYVFEVIFFCSRLVNEIRSIRSLVTSQNNTCGFKNWDALISRINMLKLIMCIYYFILILGLLPLLVLHLVLGVAPYGFAMILIAIQCPPILSFAVYMLGRGKQNRPNSGAAGGTGSQQIQPHQPNDSGSPAQPTPALNE